MPNDNSLDFFCVSCGQSLNALPELFGQTVECPTCHTQLAVPFPKPDAVTTPTTFPLKPILSGRPRTFIAPAALATSLHEVPLAIPAPAAAATRSSAVIPKLLCKLVLLPVVCFLAFIALMPIISHIISPVNPTEPSQGVTSPSNEAGLNSATRDKQAAEDIYNKSGDEALAAARMFMVGTWTYTGTGYRFLKDDMTRTNGFLKWVIREDGTALKYVAPVVANDWGTPQEDTWEVFTNKYANTGKRFYGFEFKHPNSVEIIAASIVIIEPNGQVQFRVASDLVLKMTKGDKFPFSK